MGVLEISRINDKIMFLELACPYTNEIISYQVEKIKCYEQLERAARQP